MKKVLIFVWAIVLAACGSPTSQSTKTGTVTSKLAISATGTIPVPITPIAAFGQDPVPQWDGTFVDLLAADALGMCTGNMNPITLLHKDRYLAYLQAKMALTPCGPGQAGSLPAETRWIVQRTDPNYIQCNYRGSTKQNALVSLPESPPSGSTWAGADDILYQPGTTPGLSARWAPYLINPSMTPTAGSTPINWISAIGSAQKDMMYAAINLCMANRLRQQMMTVDIFSASAAEQRQLLAVIRERAQVAMLELALMGKAFANAAASCSSPTSCPAAAVVTDAAQYLPVLRRHYEGLSLDQQRQLAADLASAVRLHIDVTHEFVELLARSALARTDVSDLGGAGFGDSDDAEWGPAGWRSRALDLLYGGDPLGDMPLSFNTSASPYPWGGLSGSAGPWEGEEVLNASLSQPEVQALLGLARVADVLYLERSAGNTYDVNASADFLWRAVEASLRNNECLPSAGCNFKADSSGVATTATYTTGLLWQRFRVAPEHARALVAALVQGLPQTPGVIQGRGPFHLSGEISTVQFPPQLTTNPGPAFWDHLAPNFAFVLAPIGLRQSNRGNLAGYYLPDTFISQHYASAQGFVGEVAPLIPKFFAPLGNNNDSMRALGAVSALAAVRDSLVAGESSNNAQGFYGITNTGIQQTLALISSAIGASTYAVRPSLEQVLVRTSAPPCGEWATQPSGVPCKVLAMQMADATTVKATVDIVRPSSAQAVKLVIVTNADAQALTGDVSSLRYIANLASQSTFKTPPASWNATTATMEAQRLDRTKLDTFAQAHAITGTPAADTNLGLTRDHYNIQWKMDTASYGPDNGNSPVLLAVSTTTPLKYYVIWDGFSIRGFNFGETRDSTATNPTFPVIRSAGGFYSGDGGSLNDWAVRITERHPTEWSRPRYDAFGFPVDWTPPVTPEILAGSSDPVAFYLGGAKEAAQDATAAVKTALDEVVQESADTQRLQASRQRSEALSTLEQQAVCGQSSCIPTTSAWAPPLGITCTDGGFNDYCNMANFILLQLLPTQIVLLDDVKAALSQDIAPSFSQFSGGSLQGFALDEWTAAKKIQRTIAESGARLDKFWASVRASQAAYDNAYAQFVQQQKADSFLLSQKKAARDYLCDDVTLRNKAFDACITYSNQDAHLVPTYRYDPTYLMGNNFNASTLNSMDQKIDDKDGKVAGINYGPFWAYEQRCKDAYTDFNTTMAQIAPHMDNSGPSGATVIATRAEAAEAVQAIFSSIVAAIVDVQKASITVNQAIADLSREEMKILFQQYLDQSGTVSQLAISRSYHQPDMWRARALLDNARRLSVAARRAIESRYNVDLTKMLDDEPFVAAPALWADDVYSYDLDPPSAVGLSRAGDAVSGLYPNKLVDYVSNLENFVRGYPVQRPTASASSDTEIITLPGPGAQNDTNGSGTSGGTQVSPDAARWSFQCTDGGPWLSNPVNKPAGEAVLNYTLQELAPPFKNHGFGSPLDLVVGTGTAPVVQPSIGTFAASLTGTNYLSTASTQVGETSGGISLSAWINVRSFCPTSTCNSQMIFTKNYHTTTWSSPWFSVNMEVDATGKLYAGAAIPGVGLANNILQAAAPGAIPLKQWVHVGMTFDGFYIRIYKNGALVATSGVVPGGQPRSIDWGQHGPWMFGGFPTTNTSWLLNTWFGQAHIDTTVRSADDFNAEYLAGVGQNQPIATWQFQESAPPYASQGSTPIPLTTSRGAPASVSASPFDSAVDFDGASCLTSGNTTAGETPSQISMSAWVYPRSHTTVVEVIAQKVYSPTTYAGPSYLSAGLDTYNGIPRAMINVAGTLLAATGTTVVPLNTWTHLGMSFDGTTISLYVNGKLAATTVVTGAPTFIDWGSHGQWMVGGNCLANQEYFNGKIADVRVEPIVRTAAFFNEAVGRGLSGQCSNDNDCVAQGDCCPDRSASPFDTMCSNGRPLHARIQFHLDPWGREDGTIANPPFTARHNVRWGRVAVNLVGTGIRDCAGSSDAVSCYAESFLRYDLTHGGPSWSTDYNEGWHVRPMPLGIIEGGKALATEEWLDPITNAWNQSFVSNVARSEFIKRPVSGIYTLDLDLGPDVRPDRIRKLQVLAETEYWVSQR